MTPELPLTTAHAPISFLAVVGVQALTIAAVLLAGRRERWLRAALPFLVSGAAGVLLATACLDLLPEAVRAGGPEVWTALLLSLLVLFCAQAAASFLRGRAEPDEAAHAVEEALQSSAPLRHGTGGYRGYASGASTPVRAAPLLLGSALHSAVDGMALAAAFLAGKRQGWSAAMAILLHELPHRVGDFSLLLRLGLSRRAAAQAAAGAGAAAFLGWSVALAIGRQSAALRWLLPVSAGTFLYIALADLVPELHAHRRGGRTGWEIVCLLAGAASMALLIHFPGE